MPDTNQGLEKENNPSQKKRSFFGGSLDINSKDFLDFRYNTKEEIDKFNDEMTITSDLDDIIKKTNQNNEFQSNKEELNETINHEDNVSDNETTIHKHNTSFNYTTNDKNNNLEFTQQDSEERKIETSETIKNYDNEEGNKIEDYDINFETNTNKIFDPFELNIEEDEENEEDENQNVENFSEDEIFDPFELYEEYQEPVIDEQPVEEEPVVDEQININTNTKEKPSKKKTSNVKKTNTEKIDLEQFQESKIEEEHIPTDEEVFEQEPEFFGDDELSQQFLQLVQNTRKIFKLEHKIKSDNTEEQSNFFKILGGKTENTKLEYLFYLIEEPNEPIDLFIKKVETSNKNNEETEHLVQFSYDKNKSLNIFVDEVILYQEINKSEPSTPGYSDTKSILEKFIFLTENYYNELKTQLENKNKEKQKKRQLQQIFKGF